MIQAALTGSHAYGTPNPDSDVDVVALVDAHTFGLLMASANSCDGSAGEAEHFGTASLRFGRLNLIATIHEATYCAWRNGTAELIARKPVTREQAVECIGAHLKSARYSDP